jgi:hypothetical protein
MNRRPVSLRRLPTAVTFVWRGEAGAWPLSGHFADRRQDHYAFEADGALGIADLGSVLSPERRKSFHHDQRRNAAPPWLLGCLA